MNIDTGILSVTSIDDRGGVINFAGGTVNFPANTILDSASLQSLLGPTHGLGPGRTINIAGPGTLGTSLSLDGGVFSVGTLTLNAPLVLNSGTLTIGSPLDVRPGGQLGDTLTLGPNLTINAVNGASVLFGGLLNLAGGRFVSGTGVITNDGEILLDGATSLLSSNITNNHLLSGDGRIAGRITNAAPGEVRVSTGQRINITGTGGNNLNLGQINLFGGVIELTSLLLNSAGARITGRGTIIAHGGLALNSATMALSGQTSDVFGAVVNDVGGKIIITGGSTSTFVDAVTNVAGSEFRVSTASTAVFLSNVSGLGQFTGSGIKDFESSASAGPLATSGSSIVGPDGALTAQHVRESSLHVDGVVTIQPNGTNSGTSRLNSLTIDAGTYDLNDNDLVIDYTGASSYSTILGYLASGALRSSTAIASTTPKTAMGIAENSVLGLSNFSGQPVDATSILIKYTFAGDANLDGQVDVTDLGALATNWQTHNVWTGGDFNYDGFIDVTDLGALATNWQAGIGSPLASSRFEEALAAVGLGGVAVPEPAATALLGLGMITFRTRRRS